MTWTGTGVSTTRNAKLQSAKHGIIHSSNQITERADKAFFKDSSGKFFRVSSVKSGDGYDNFRTKTS